MLEHHLTEVGATVEQRACSRANACPKHLTSSSLCILAGAGMFGGAARASEAQDMTGHLLSVSGRSGVVQSCPSSFPLGRCSF